MLDQEQIDRLIEIGRQHIRELLGSSPARASGSEPDGEEAASSTPASFDAVGSGERASL